MRFVCFARMAYESSPMFSIPRLIDKAIAQDDSFSTMSDMYPSGSTTEYVRDRDSHVTVSVEDGLLGPYPGENLEISRSGVLAGSLQWRSADNYLFIWRLGDPDDSVEVALPDGQSVLEVGLTQGEGGEAIVVVATVLEIVTLTLGLSRIGKLLPPVFTGQRVAVDGGLVSVITGGLGRWERETGLKNPRIFVGFEDGSISEILISNSSSLKKQKLSETGIRIVSIYRPFVSIFPFGSWLGGWRVDCLSFENDREILFSISNQTVSVFSVGGDHFADFSGNLLFGNKSRPINVLPISNSLGGDVIGVVIGSAGERVFLILKNGKVSVLSKKLSDRRIIVKQACLVGPGVHYLAVDENSTKNQIISILPDWSALANKQGDLRKNRPVGSIPEIWDIWTIPEGKEIELMVPDNSKLIHPSDLVNGQLPEFIPERLLLILKVSKFANQFGEPINGEVREIAVLSRKFPGDILREILKKFDIHAIREFCLSWGVEQTSAMLLEILTRNNQWNDDREIKEFCERLLFSPDISRALEFIDPLDQVLGRYNSGLAALGYSDKQFPGIGYQVQEKSFEVSKRMRGALLFLSRRLRGIWNQEALGISLEVSDQNQLLGKRTRNSAEEGYRMICKIPAESRDHAISAISEFSQFIEKYRAHLSMHVSMGEERMINDLSVFVKLLIEMLEICSLVSSNGRVLTGDLPKDLDGLSLRSLITSVGSEESAISRLLLIGAIDATLARRHCPGLVSKGAAEIQSVRRVLMTGNLLPAREVQNSVRLLVENANCLSDSFSEFFAQLRESSALRGLIDLAIAKAETFDENLLGFTRLQEERLKCYNLSIKYVFEVLRASMSEVNEEIWKCTKTTILPEVYSNEEISRSSVSMLPCAVAYALERSQDELFHICLFKWMINHKLPVYLSSSPYLVNFLRNFALESYALYLRQHKQFKEAASVYIQLMTGQQECILSKREEFFMKAKECLDGRLTRELEEGHALIKIQKEMIEELGLRQRNGDDPVIQLNNHLFEYSILYNQYAIPNKLFESCICIRYQTGFYDDPIGLKQLFESSLNECRTKESIRMKVLRFVEKFAKSERPFLPLDLLAKHCYRLGGAQLVFDTLFDTNLSRHEMLQIFRLSHIIEGEEDRKELSTATVIEWLNELEINTRKDELVLLQTDLDDLQSRGLYTSDDSIRLKIRQLMTRR